MSSNRSSRKLIKEYEKSHQHPVNQLTHLVGIPMIALSIPLAVVSLFITPFRRLARALFVLGWSLQLMGHAIEGRRPELLNDWRFIFAGVRWWTDRVSES